MPTLNVSDFDHAPKVGDAITVDGKVKSINEDTGEVDVSYDKISFVNKKESTKNAMPNETMPNSNSLDQALSQAFDKTQ